MKKAMVILLIALVKLMAGQKDSAQKFKLGFNLGASYSRLAIERSAPSGLHKTSSFNGPGLRLGIIMDHGIGRNFAFMPKTELSFNEAGYVVEKSPGHYERRYIYPVTLEFAGHLAAKTSYHGKRPYFLFGPSLKIPVPGKTDPYLLNTRTPTFALDAGLGFDKALREFDIAPEVRYSFGLTKITNVEGLSRVSFHTLGILINFKG